MRSSCERAVHPGCVRRRRWRRQHPPPPAPPARRRLMRDRRQCRSDATATLPNATVSLAGSATDDGPAASLTYQWSSAARPRRDVLGRQQRRRATHVYHCRHVHADAHRQRRHADRHGHGCCHGQRRAGRRRRSGRPTTTMTRIAFHGWAKVERLGRRHDAAAAWTTAATFAQNVPPATSRSRHARRLRATA